MLVGEHLRLRALESADLEVLWSWHDDPTLQIEMGSRGTVRGHEDEAAWLAAELDKTLPMEGRTFLIEGLGNEQPEPLGCTWYGAYDPIDRHALVGLFLAHPRARGKGWGQEALALLLAHLFDDLGLHKARLHVRADHPTAIGTYRKLGFIEEGRLRHHAFYAGRFHDFLVMGLLEDEYRHLSG